MRRLVIRPGGIGDCILSLPAIECLRAEYTDVWVAAPNLPLIRGYHAARAIAATGLDLFGLPGVEPPPALVESLRSFDSIVSWYGAAREDFRRETGRLGLPFTFFDALPPAAGCIHAADFFLSQAQAICSRRVDAIPRLECPRAAGDSAVIHPFSGSPRKNWPLENFRAVAALLEPRMPVRWCAGPEEPLAEAVRFDNLHELACWLASARVYIGNDSGITHLAAAAGAPVIALFGPTDPAVWAPRGPNARVVRMADATPESVAALATAGSRSR